jgi:hypothetical protein
MTVTPLWLRRSRYPPVWSSDPCTRLLPGSRERFVPGMELGAIKGCCRFTHCFLQLRSLVLWHLTACSYEVLSPHAEQYEILCTLDYLDGNSVHGGAAVK